MADNEDKPESLRNREAMVDDLHEETWVEKIESLILHLEQSNQTLHKEVFERIKWTDGIN
ncbi:hypothetical protein [Vibrio nigripulchritudo]|uniref:hypothetical protein n=1 Tax=Vibrio nigripulchritudo TaxID=28173 RepID=UPI0005FA7A1F|nr:hypothetical protein [Vibrio nigripulchritudo]KJY75086.1 hypothetical protein TW74_17200 [Vibrio nigripulchritudo]